MRARHLAAAAIFAIACGGGGGGGNGGGGTPPPPPAVATVGITPAGAQSIAVGGTVAFAAQPRDAQNNTLSRTVTWTTSDATKVSLSSTSGSAVTATGVAAGTSNIRATADGIPSADITVTVTGGGGAPPQSASVTASAASTFDPSSVTIGAGGTVTWTFVALPEHNVTFGTNKPTGGDIGNTSSASVSRTFPNVGSYPYTCTLHAGMNGTVTVVAP
jgi:plastocyanin